MKRRQSVVLVMAVLIGAASTAAREQDGQGKGASSSRSGIGSQKPNSLPDGVVLLQRFIDATGGNRAYSEIKTEAAKAEITFTQTGMKGQLNVYTARGGKQYSSFDLPGLGKIEAGSDGTTNWERSVMLGPRLVPRSESGAGLLGPDRDMLLQWSKADEKIETVSTENVAGSSCYLVRITPRQGGQASTACFDAETGYLLQLKTSVQTQMGKMPFNCIFGDYRADGPIKTAHHVETQVAGQPVNIDMTEITVNGPVPDGIFDLPDDIRALKAKKAAAASSIDEPFERPTLRRIR